MADLVVRPAPPTRALDLLLRRMLAWAPTIKRNTGASDVTARIAGDPPHVAVTVSWPGGDHVARISLEESPFPSGMVQAREIKAGNGQIETRTVTTRAAGPHPRACTGDWARRVIADVLEKRGVMDRAASSRPAEPKPAAAPQGSPPPRA